LHFDCTRPFVAYIAAKTYTFGGVRLVVKLAGHDVR